MCIKEQCINGYVSHAYLGQEYEDCEGGGPGIMYGASADSQHQALKDSGRIRAWGNFNLLSGIPWDSFWSIQLLTWT